MLHSVKEIGKIKLNNFTEEAITYSGISPAVQEVDFYLFRSPENVYGAAIYQPKSFDKNLVVEFLNNLKSIDSN